MAGTRGGSVKHISLVELYALRPEHSQEFGTEVLRPVGAGKGKKDDGLFSSSAFHGFRVGSPRDRAAPPVATFRRPVGAVTSHPVGLKEEKSGMLSPRAAAGKTLTRLSRRVTLPSWAARHSLGIKAGTLWQREEYG